MLPAGVARAERLAAQQQRAANQLADQKRRKGGRGDGGGHLTGQDVPVPVRGVRSTGGGRDVGEQQPQAHIPSEIVLRQVGGGVQVDQRRVVVAGEPQGGDQPTARTAGSGAHQQPDAGIGGFARQLAQSQGECGRVVGLVERIHRDRERLLPLQQPVDQAVKIVLLCPGRDGKRAHDLAGRGGAGVDRDIDGVAGQACDRVVGGKRARHADAVPRIGHGDQPGQHG